ncbi:Homoisocitrate dehydrogenase [uncultured archaeon]|nr:Homoisocitrate dehydrogenase [uncultured archaeon]
MKERIAILPGDGIGPEIMLEAVNVLLAVGEKFGHTFVIERADFGGAAYDKSGHPFPDATKKICDRADAILKGPVGGPKYDKIPDADLRPERGGVLALRARYHTFANIRPVKLPVGLSDFSPLKPRIIPDGIDIVMIRELMGGIYFGKKEEGMMPGGEPYALDEMRYTRQQVEAIARVAFREAKERNAVLHNIHKSNVLKCSVFWNAIVEKIHTEEFPDVTLAHMLVDSAAYNLVLNPAQFSVMLLENMMGDILSDEGGAIIGSLGLMPSACIGPEKSYYEPSHGSAPALAGKNVANPYSMIGSAALMLEKSFGMHDEAKCIWDALFRVFAAGYRTGELANAFVPKEKIVSTSGFGSIVVKEILEE